MDNTNNIDMNLVAQSLAQKLNVSEYTAASWEAKANQLAQQNQQLKAELEQLQQSDKKENGGK